MAATVPKVTVHHLGDGLSLHARALACVWNLESAVFWRAAQQRNEH